MAQIRMSGRYPRRNPPRLQCPHDGVFDGKEAFVVLQRPRRMAPIRKSAPKPTVARRVFAPMVEAGAAAYVRARDLPRLIALWPRELEDESNDGRRLVLAKLRRALRAERRRGAAGHWSYDLNRHLGLLSAYRGELALLGRAGPATQPNCTRRGKDFAGG